MINILSRFSILESDTAPLLRVSRNVLRAGLLLAVIGLPAAGQSSNCNSHLKLTFPAMAQTLLVRGETTEIKVNYTTVSMPFLATLFLTTNNPQIAFPPNTTVPISGQSNLGAIPILFTPTMNGTFPSSVEVVASTSDSVVRDDCVYPLSALNPMLVDPTFDKTLETVKKIDPVSAATLELSDSDETVDLQLGGPLDFKFARYYASLLSVNGVNSALGQNWMHNFEARLELDSYELVLTRYRGRRIHFRKNGSLFALNSTEEIAYQLTGNGTSYSFLDPAANIIYTFGVDGKLTAISDRNGNTLTVTYNSTDPGPTRVADGLGRTLDFVYSQGKLSKVTDNGGRSVSFLYTGNTLTSATDANGKVVRFTYSQSGVYVALKTSTTLPLGNKIRTQEYTTDGRVSKQTDTLGNSYTVDYGKPAAGTNQITDPSGGISRYTNPSYNLATYVDPAGNTETRTFDTKNRPLTVTNRQGEVSTFTYDTASGFPATITDALGNKTSFTYITQTQANFTFYRLSRIANPDGSTVNFTYDANGNLATMTDGLGQQFQFTHDSKGLRTSETNPAGGVTKRTYNSNGTLASITYPYGDTDSYSYDTFGRISSVKFPDGATRSYTYDNMDRLLTEKDERGNTVSFNYDDNGNLTSIADAAGQTMRFEYDSENRVSRITPVTGAASTLKYNSLNNVASATNGAGETTSLAYDSAQGLTAMTDASGNVTKFTHDKELRLTGYTDATGLTWTYVRDKDGHITQLKDPQGGTYDFAFDSMHRVTSIRNPIGQSSTYTYDKLGLPANAVLAGGLSVAMARNTLGQITSITDPNGNVTQQAFDSGGRLVSRTDPLGRTFTYAYDQREQLATYTTGEGTLTNIFDASGNRITQQYSDGTVNNLTYDPRNKVTGGDGLQLGYDADGSIVASNGLTMTRDGARRLKSITLADGKTVTYTYDSGGRLSKVQDWLGGSTDLAYDNANRLLKVNRPNGVSTVRTYDKTGNLASIVENGPGGTLASATLTRDAAGRVISADRNVPQLAAVAAGVNAPAFDAANQVAGSTYDTMGRLTSDSLRQYTWNLASRLTGYSGADGQAAMTYDAFGMRISRTWNAVEEDYVLNYGLGIPSIGIVRATGVDQRYYVHTPGGMLLYGIDADTGARHFYHFDEAGNTLLLTADDGTVTDSYGMGPYGESLTLTGATINPFTFGGAFGVMQENSTGLYYMRARYYDSSTARFLSPDPVRSLSPAKINAYQYAAGNPLSNFDPMGMDVCPVAVGVNVASSLSGTLFLTSLATATQAQGIETQVENTFVLIRQLNGLDEGEEAAVGIFGPIAAKGLALVPGLEGTAQTLKSVSTVTKGVGTALQVAAIAVDAVEYQQSLNQAQTDADKFNSQADTIYNKTIDRLRTQYKAGKINETQYRNGVKLALSEVRLQAANADLFQINDIAISALTFFEHALATFTPIPPSAIDATSKKLAQ